MTCPPTATSNSIPPAPALIIQFIADVLRVSPWPGHAVRRLAEVHASSAVGLNTLLSTALGVAVAGPQQQVRPRPTGSAQMLGGRRQEAGGMDTKRGL